MSHLNISFSDFADSKYRVGPGYPLKETHLKLRILARAVLSALNLKIADLTAIQAGQVLKKTKCNACEQGSKHSREDHPSDAQYHHLVELGQWHHRRQRRRNRYH